MAVAAKGVIVRAFERTLLMKLTSPVFNSGDLLPRRFAKETTLSTVEDGLLATGVLHLVGARRLAAGASVKRSD